MSLFTYGFNFKPENRFFGHLNHGAFFIAGIRHYNQIFLSEDFCLVENIFNAFLATCLFVCYQSQPDVISRLNIFSQQSLNGKNRSN